MVCYTKDKPMKHVWIVIYFGTVLKVFSTLRSAEKYIESEERIYHGPHSNASIHIVKRKIQA